MALQIQTGTGPQNTPFTNLRITKQGALVSQDEHARFQEAALAGVLYSGGMTQTSINAATFTTGTLGATCTPIVGIYNPSTSGKNAIIIQAKLQLINTALQMTGAGAFMWCYSVGNTAVTTGNTPLNRLLLQKTGSVMKDMSGVALTGLTTTLTVGEAGAFGSHLSIVSTLQTAAGLMTTIPSFVDNLDGSIIVPPGGVLALLSAGTPVAVSAASSLLWEEALV